MFGLENLIKWFGLRRTYFYSLMAFAACMFLTVLLPSVSVMLLCTAISGVSTAVTASIPYALITIYHNNPEVFYLQAMNDESNKKQGLAACLAITDQTYTLSQILLSLFLGQLVEVTGLPSMYILVSAMCSFLAAWFSTRCVYNEPRPDLAPAVNKDL